MASHSSKKVTEKKITKSKSIKDSSPKSKITKQKIIKNSTTPTIKSQEKDTKSKLTKQKTTKESKTQTDKSQEKNTKPKSKIIKQKTIKDSKTQTNKSLQKDEEMVDKDDKKEPNVSRFLTKNTIAFSKTLGDNSEWFITSVTKVYNYYKIRKIGLITFRHLVGHFIKFIKNIKNNDEQNENEILQNTTKETIIKAIIKNYNIHDLQKILHLINVLIALGVFSNILSSSRMTKEDIVTNYEPNAINEQKDDKNNKIKLNVSNCISNNDNNLEDELDVYSNDTYDIYDNISNNINDNNSNDVDYIITNYTDDNLNDIDDSSSDDNSSDDVDDDFSNIEQDNDKMNDIDDDLDNDDDINIVFGDTNKVRDYFTEDEITKIINEAEKDTKYNLIVCLLLYNGFRIKGLINIKMENIYDYQNNKLKYDGKTLERRNTYRYFSISRNEKLINAFNNYLEAFPDVLEKRGYLFPHKDRYDKSTSTTTIQKIIKNICKKCNIRANLAHVHAFRKTVVVRLMKEQNNLDKIATFIGHKSSATTFKHYWNPSGEDMLKDMNIPWINKLTTGIQLSDIKKIDNHVRNIAKTETSETNVNEEYLQFIKKVYWPLKKDTSILEERLKIVKMLLSEKNKKTLDNKVKEIENTIDDKYKEAEKQNEWDNLTNTNETCSN
jgi:hypothetical protein